MRRAISAGWAALIAALPVGCRRAPEVGTPAGPDTLLARLEEPAPFELTPAQASRFVGLSLRCSERPWPNKPGHVYEREEQVRASREVTPAFYGCFDWHSAVHGHWAMLRLLERFPGLAEASQVRARLDQHLSPEPMAQELAFFGEARSRTFERPYGWGWLLRLHGELAGSEDPDAKRWEAAVRPLAKLLSDRTRDYLTRLTVPIRAGTHSNTAFALVHMLDAARATGDEALQAAIVEHARRFYLADRHCPTAWEPSGEDFISPCLAEADLMRRVLPAAELAPWLDAFLPPLTSPEFEPLLRPVEVRDREDPRIGHLIGLAFHRAWCYAGLASSLPEGDPRRPVFDRLAGIHRQAGLADMFASGYGGEHWLASFAIYLLTGVGVGR